MYKSAVGLFITNIFMIWLVDLNNVGPGWEVPATVMWAIELSWIVIIIGFIFSAVMLFISLKQLTTISLVFSLFYFGGLITSLAFLIFLIATEAYHGQYWQQDFSRFAFSFVSIGLDIFFLIVISVFRFRNKNVAQ